MPGLGKVLGVIFAIFAALACFGIGNMTQGNSIASSMESTFGISPMVSGIVVAIIVAVVIIGGIKSIARVTEMIVPFMAAFYIIFSLIILVIHAGELPTALVDVFKGAFNPESVLGGGAGVAVMTAVRMGFARGVFSNEAGLGSAPIAHAASSQKDPVKQGLWGIFEVFVDTILICTMTALVILTATDADGSFFWQGGEYAGAALTLKAFEVGLPGIIGSVGLTIGLLLFALSTMLGWSYYGEKAWEYLFRNNEAVRKVVVMIFRIVYVVAVPIGATGGLEFVWGVADTLNGCMAVPNLIGVLLLSGVVLAETKRYFTDLKKDKLQ
jgi:AGCS family alanine or glycine:cation symporter